LLVIFAVGCGPDSDKDGSHKPFKDPKPTAQPPAPPPRRDVALDPELRAAADRELSDSLKSEDPILRVHALEGIRDSNSTKHRQEIVNALHDPQPVVRFAAALAATMAGLT